MQKPGCQSAEVPAGAQRALPVCICAGVKHAHSQQNPEKDWGNWPLQSVEFAYFVLNDKYGNLACDGASRLKKFTPANTTVIASSVPNGAGSALAAAEQDTQGLISGTTATNVPPIQTLPAAADHRRLIRFRPLPSPWRCRCATGFFHGAGRDRFSVAAPGHGLAAVTSMSSSSSCSGCRP